MATDYSQGDYRVVAQRLLPAAQELVDAAAPAAGNLVVDAAALPVSSQVADAALSTFGLIYVEEAAVAVAEMARVCRPGGVIGLTAWEADGYQKAFAGLLRETLDLVVTHDFLGVWGTPAAIEEQLAPLAGDVQVRTADLVDRFPSVDDWWRARETSPPMANARSLLDDAGYAELGRRMRALAEQFGEQEGGFVLRDHYLVATARVR